MVVSSTDTPSVVVGGLDTEVNGTSATSSEVITLTVTKDDLPKNANDVKQAAASNGKQVGMILDMHLSKMVDGKSATGYNETAGLLEVIVPLPTELQGKDSYAIYRYYNSGVDTVTTTPNNDGEYIVINAEKTQITLYVKKFSTYAVGYANRVPKSRSGGSGSISTSYIITASAGEGGSFDKTSVSVVKGGSKTFVITANKGYEVSDVKVDGKSVGIVSSYTFSNVSSAHTISATFERKETIAYTIELKKTNTLPYYIENGKEVFIGFACEIDGKMKYIAPKGVAVLFKENPTSFTDIADHWAKNKIDFVTEREILAGTGGSKFSPKAGMTHAMFATVIGRLYERAYGKLSIKDSHAFTDVNYNAYYGAYIDWAAENDIIIGIGGGVFEPDREITRQEMAVVLCHFAEFLQVIPADMNRTLKYTDSSSISTWANDAALYCQSTNIITGRDGGNFVPQGTATRDEVAVILQRFIEIIVE